MEELNKQVASQILASVSFNSLPKQVKQLVGNAKQYHQIVLKYSLKRQMPWRKDSLIAQVVSDPRQYYIQLMKSSHSELMVHTKQRKKSQKSF